MTVRIFTQIEKEAICTAISLKQMSVKEAALNWNTSSSTIRRTLIDKGYHTPVPQLQADAEAIMQYLRLLQIDNVRDLKDFHLYMKYGFVEPTWFDKCKNYLKSVFRMKGGNLAS